MNARLRKTEFSNPTGSDAISNREWCTFRRPIPVQYWVSHRPPRSLNRASPDHAIRKLALVHYQRRQGSTAATASGLVRLVA